MNPQDINNPENNPQNNPQSNPYNNFNQFGGQQPVPNSTAVLVLGIISIVLCICYGIVAVILGIIAIVLASQGEKAYTENPNLYSLPSYKNLKAGKVCAIIGLSLGALYIIVAIIYFITVGTLLFNNIGRF